MHFSNWGCQRIRHQKICQVSVRSQNLPDIQNWKFMVQHCWHLPGITGSVDCHISTTVQPFLPGLICYSSLLSSEHLIPSLPPSVLMHSFESAIQSAHHRTVSYIICTLGITVSILFHTVHCMCRIYGVDSSVLARNLFNSLGPIAYISVVRLSAS